MSQRSDDVHTPLTAPTSGSPHHSHTVVLPDALLPERTCLGMSMKTVNVILLGLSFCFLFSVFNPCQNYQSTVNKTYGETSLGVLYLSFAITGFFAPTIVQSITEKWGMFGGGLMYVIYMGSNILMSYPELQSQKENVKWAFFVAASLNGIGASILWTGQGSFLTKNSTKQTMGRNTGIFFGLFQVNQIAGNLLASGLLSTHLLYWKLFLILTCMGFVAVLTFMVLRQPPKQVAVEDDEDETPKKPTPVGLKILSTFKTLVTGKFFLLAPIIIYSGLSQSFYFGRMTKWVGESIGQDWTGYVMAAFGGLDVLGSFALGRLIDKYGRKPVVFFGLVAALASLTLFLVIPIDTYKANYFLFFIVAGLFGLADASFFTSLYAIIGTLFKSNPENGFGAFRLLQSTTTAVFFFIGPFINLYVAAGLMGGFMLIGIVLVLIIDWCIEPIDGRKDSKHVQH